MNNPPLAALEQAAREGNEMARLELANRLIESAPGSPERERGLSLLHECAKGPQAPAAQWLLGGFYLQNLSLPDGPVLAQQWLEAAVESGVAPAFDRLANWHLRGINTEYSPERAISLLQHLADVGFQRSAWDIGYLLTQESGNDKLNEATTAFARACALGYPQAYYSLGLRFALGSGVAQDRAFARALLLRAADAGLPDARDAADELAPSSQSGSEAERWYHSIKQNYDQAEGMHNQLMQGGLVIDPRAQTLVSQVEQHFSRINHPALSINSAGRLVVSGDGEATLKAEPQPWEWLAQKPRVAISQDFITREERAYLMFMVAGSLSQPRNYTSQTSNGEVENELFSGQGHSMGAMTSDTVVRVIEQRIARMTDWRIDALEPSSVIAYQPGHEYRPHVDYFSAEQIAHNREQHKDLSGQRVVTFLVCLQAADAGGETIYNRTGLKVGYRAGQALMHYNTDQSGQPEPLSQHAGEPVTQGQKWLFRTTLREHSRYFGAAE